MPPQFQHLTEAHTLSEGEYVAAARRCFNRSPALYRNGSRTWTIWDPVGNERKVALTCACPILVRSVPFPASDEPATDDSAF